MNGQLWQECFCGTDPVCSMCEKCKSHCTCGKTRAKTYSPPAPEPYRRGIGQGFGPGEDGDPSDDEFDAAW